MNPIRAYKKWRLACKLRSLVAQLAAAEAEIVAAGEHIERLTPYGRSVQLHGAIDHYDYLHRVAAGLKVQAVFYATKLAQI